MLLIKQRNLQFRRICVILTTMYFDLRLLISELSTTIVLRDVLSLFAVCVYNEFRAIYTKYSR